jgi:hypothetical protein
MRKSGPGKKRRAENPRVGTDQKGFSVVRISTCQLDEASGAIPFGEFAAVPPRRPAAVAWKQPDLEDLEGVFAAIVLGMTDSGAGAHDLDIAGNGPADVAGAIFMRDRPLPDVCNDFHVRVSVAAEAGAGRDLVVIPDHKGPEGAVRGIAVTRNDEMVARLQPAVIAVIERLFGSKLQHAYSLIADAMDIRFREWLWRWNDRRNRQQIKDWAFHLMNDL